MNVWSFMDSSPWLTFFLALILASVIKTVICLPHRFYKTWCRRKNIAEHGWPTAPVDADGDIVYPDPDDDED